MNTLNVKGMEIGTGRPKIIVSIMDAEVSGMAATIDAGKQAGTDCFEWRADFATAVHNPETMAATSRQLGSLLPHNPLIFTFRSVGQGGKLDLPPEEYLQLNRTVVEAGAVDMVDIELGIGDDNVRTLTQFAHDHGVAVIVSHHDFEKTPNRDTLAGILEHMESLGADIAKIACMATSDADALEVLAATDARRAQAQRLLLTMAMGQHGSITRLLGEQFGSAMTFCALEQASAPGQVDVAQARCIMDELHKLA